MLSDGPKETVMPSSVSGDSSINCANNLSIVSHNDSKEKLRCSAEKTISFSGQDSVCAPSSRP